MHTLLKLTLAGAMTPWLAAGQAPLRLSIAGLVHGHVDGFLHAAAARKDVQIAGIFDPDTALQRHYAERFGIPQSVFFTDLGAMLDRVKPEAVALFTSTFDHAIVVQACARRHIHVMMEKPLAVSMADARAIQHAAHEGGIQVIVNYETTWYPSHAAMWRLVKERHAAGGIRKMVAMDGHEGPKEIGVGPEFLGWLTDPVKNGAGALFDFGCYGANLMTWMMDNQRPVAVTAITQTIKPQIYARVDDEASVLVEYPKAQGIIQASWNWPFGRKDFEVYGERGYAIASGGDALRVRLPGGKEEARALDPLPPDEHDSISYLSAVVRGKLKPAGLSSLENNMIVTEILVAARESARTGRTIKLGGGSGAMTLFGVAAIELLAMWALWLYPFLRKRFSGPKRRSEVMAHSGDWGLALESAGIFCAWCWLPNTPVPSAWRMIVSMILAPVGAAFGWLAVRHLGKQLRVLAGLYADHELIRSGPYAVVRHPVYATLFMMMLATGLLFARWQMLLLGVVLYIAGTEIRIHAEEGLLRARFGQEFEEYRRKVPAYLPFLR